MSAFLLNEDTLYEDAALSLLIRVELVIFGTTILQSYVSSSLRLLTRANNSYTSPVITNACAFVPSS